MVGLRVYVYLFPRHDGSLYRLGLRNRHVFSEVFREKLLFLAMLVIARIFVKQ